MIRKNDEDQRINQSWAKEDDESEYEYIYRICSSKDSIGTWSMVAEIINAELGCEYTESKYRKQFQSLQKMIVEHERQNAEGCCGGESANSLISERIREISRERIKLQTEKLEYSRWLREHSRDELITEKIVDAVRALPALEFHIEPEPPILPDGFLNPEKVGVVCYGDEHYGTEFCIKGIRGDIINQYSPEIFEERMNSLLYSVINKGESMGLSKIKVYSFGDELDGILRVSQLMKLRYGVVDSAIIYAEFMSRWLNELSKHFFVEFQMTSGNHTELRMIGQPKSTFKEDNMSKVIRHIIRIRLENNPKFKFIENESGLIYDEICGFHILGIHGEVKKINEAIKSLSVVYDTPIDILIGGHKHHLATETVGMFKDVVSLPSIIGVDSYSMQLNRVSNPGALFLVIEDGLGITEQHNIKFF